MSVYSNKTLCEEARSQLVLPEEDATWLQALLYSSSMPRKKLTIQIVNKLKPKSLTALSVNRGTVTPAYFINLYDPCKEKSQVFGTVHVFLWKKGWNVRYPQSAGKILFTLMQIF